MSGSLRDLGGGRWKLTMYAGSTPDKRKHQRTRTFRANGIRDAERKADAIRETLRKVVDEDASRRDTIAGLADQWMRKKAGECSPSTVVNYQRLADKIVAKFGRMRAVDLTPRDIDLWYLELREAGASGAQVAHIHSVLRAMLNDAHGVWEMVDRVATKPLKLPAPTPAEHRLPTVEALTAALAAADTDVAVALLVAMHTGARRGEVVGLQWADLNGHMLHIRRSLLDVKGHAGTAKSTKSKATRRVELAGDLVDALVVWRTEQTRRCREMGIAESPWMFAVMKPRRGETLGGPHAPSWLSKRWAQLGLDVRLHDLRHWHASTLIANGMSVVAVSQRLGHSKVSTTSDIYAHVLPGERSQAPDIIAGVLGRG